MQFPQAKVCFFCHQPTPAWLLMSKASECCQAGVPRAHRWLDRVHRLAMTAFIFDSNLTELHSTGLSRLLQHHFRLQDLSIGNPGDFMWYAPWRLDVRSAGNGVMSQQKTLSSPCSLPMQHGHWLPSACHSRYLCLPAQFAENSLKTHQNCSFLTAIRKVRLWQRKLHLTAKVDSAKSTPFKQHPQLTFSWMATTYWKWYKNYYVLLNITNSETGTSSHHQYIFWQQDPTRLPLFLTELNAQHNTKLWFQFPVLIHHIPLNTVHKHVTLQDPPANLPPPLPVPVKSRSNHSQSISLSIIPIMQIYQNLKWNTDVCSEHT